MKLFIKNTILAAGLVAAATSCNKDLKDDVSTTNDKLDGIQAAIDNDSEAFDAVTGNKLDLTVDGFYTSNQEAFEKTFEFSKAFASDMTLEETFVVKEDEPINGTDENFTYTERNFSITVNTKNPYQSSEAGATNSSVEFEFTVFTDVVGISETKFEDWLAGGDVKVGEVDLDDADFNLNDYDSNGINVWSINRDINAAGETSYGLKITDFVYEPETRKISFSIETINLDDLDANSDETLDITGTFSGKIARIEDSAYRTK